MQKAEFNTWLFYWVNIKTMKILNKTLAINENTH